MRIVSYNILDGGEGRADPIAEVLLAQRPDAVALVEADNLDVVTRIARRLNMDYIHAPGREHAAAILCRFAIRDSINHAALHPTRIQNSFLEATVLDEHHQPWTLAALHLHPHATDADERQRLDELAFVLGILRRHRDAGRPHLVMGDFNANSPIQRIDPARCKPRTQQEWQANGNRLPQAAIQAVLDAGYIDTLAAARPADAPTAATFTTQYPGQRVDYLLAWGLAPARIRDAWIEQDRLARYASDHYPVGAEVA